MYLDLHVHLRGTICPDKAKVLALRHAGGGPITESEKESFDWTGFSGFLQAYDRVASLVRTAQDLEEVAFEYLEAAASCNTIYVEFMLSPPDLAREGVPYEDQLKALSSAWERSREAFGIESRLVVTCVRHLGPEAALEAAKLAASKPHPYVVGFGLTGDEQRYDIDAFGPAFRLAREAGLSLTAHAGEHREAESVREAVEVLGLSRVGHGVRAAEDWSILKFLANAGIGLEVCISSNLALSLYPSLHHHPLPTLIAAGVKCSLGTDDPGFFNTSPMHEYTLAGEICGWGIDADIILSKQAVDMAFCDSGTKADLRAKLGL